MESWTVSVENVVSCISEHFA